MVGSYSPILLWLVGYLDPPGTQGLAPMVSPSVPEAAFQTLGFGRRAPFKEPHFLFIATA